MASTNKTAHYELSQYIGSDKPTYLVDYNMDMYNIDQGIYNAQSKADTNEGSIGNLSNLETTDKSTLVNAINEIESNVTTNTSNIASLSDKVTTNEGNIGDLTTLTTTSKVNLVSAVNEVQSETDSNTSNIGLLSNLTTTAKNNIVSAVNEVQSETDSNTSNIGDLTTLTTTAKNNLVSAINEVNGKQIDDIYSATETLTNKVWIDGKPIYRQVITGTKVSGTDFTQSISNVDTMISMHGYIKAAGGSTYPLPQWEDSSIYTRVEFKNDNILIGSTTSGYANGQFALICEYTKTTN